MDDDGRRTSVRYPGGATQTWTLDGAGRPTQIKGVAAGTTRLDLAFTRTSGSAPATPTNPNRDTDLIHRIRDAVAAQDTYYGYDGVNRLVVANTNPTTSSTLLATEQFCYDTGSNLTRYYTAASATCTTTNPTRTMTYDGADQLVSATGTGLTGTGFSYDGNGNQTSAISAPGRTVTYNDRDQAVTTTPTGGAAITSRYATTGNLERVAAGNTTFQPSPLSPAPASSATNGTSTWTVRDPDGQLIALRVGPTATPASATSYYPFTDQIGSVRTLVTATGTVAAAYTYTAYGTTKTATGTLAATNPYRYGQGYTDTATGLIKLGARYYDPTHGRFTQIDPSGQDDHYTYAVNNPIAYIDSNGLHLIRPYGQRDAYCSFSPDSFGFGQVDFRGPCANHDDCYGPSGSGSKDSCDRTFRAELKHNCAFVLNRSWQAAQRLACNRTADLYYGFVQAIGGFFFQR